MSKILATGLLAPVPESRLIGGTEVCSEQGKVGFGTRVWETFHDLEQEAGIGAPVLIYASVSRGFTKSEGPERRQPKRLGLNVRGGTP